MDPSFNLEIGVINACSTVGLNVLICKRKDGAERPVTEGEPGRKEVGMRVGVGSASNWLQPLWTRSGVDFMLAPIRSHCMVLSKGKISTNVFLVRSPAAVWGTRKCLRFFMRQM